MMNNVWTQDLAAMGRLVGIPYFFTNDAHEEELHDLSILRRAKADEEKRRRQNAENAEDSDSSEESSSESDSEDQYKALQVQIALRIQSQFEGRVIRRHRESLDWEGKVIVDIPDYIEKTLLLKLTDHEMEIIQELADQVREK